MKAYRLAIIFLLVCSIYSGASAEKLPPYRWDHLVDVAYKFSWYPKEDLLDLLEMKSGEYGQSLEEYRNLLLEELTDGSTKTGLINPGSFVSGKSWKKYYRLAVAHFCLFLATDNEIHLENAKTSLSVLSGKKELSEVAFWHYLFQAYSDLAKRDRDAFVTSVFHIWQDVVLKLEIDDILMGSVSSKSEFVKNLPFLYENIAHLIIRGAIIEKIIPDLYPLGVIIMSMRDKLHTNGYRNIVEAIAERMHGIKSDNYNLNFAVAFVEATATQYNFEDEKSLSLIVQKYNVTHTYYNLALSWADTRKGKAAILTQYMGFITHLTRRLIDRDPLLTNPLFTNLPGAGSELADSALALYDQLVEPAIQEGGFKAEGFHNRNNYLKAMHQLWDSSTKLLIMLSAYYKINGTPNKPGDMHPVESPLLQYLSFFRKYAEENSKTVPDCAFFLAAYAANELADLYRQAAQYSTKIAVNDLALAYQLQAVELFPMNITGILQLAHQTNEEGRINLYFRCANPLASRFRTSKVATTWLENHSTDYKNSISLVSDIIPDLIDNGSFLTKFLQHSEGSEEELCHKIIVMTKFLLAVRGNHSEEVIEKALFSLGKQDFRDKDKTVNELLQICLPEEFKGLENSIPGIGASYYITKLRNELYGSTDHVIHSYLRELYYEIPVEKHHYLGLMRKASEEKMGESK
jgi:hypothetical protein